jgi:hypothetical protein
MSDPENFLTRWSRRKLEAEEEVVEKSEPQRAAAAESAPPVETAGEQPVAGVEAAKAPEPPTVDLSALPPIESITAETDIRAFLQPGIPLQLTRAALRRVWTADPAIRDFVGPAENAWDFTAPDGIPGFGPLQPNDLAGLTVAQATEQIVPPSPPEVAEPLRNPDVSAAQAAPMRPAPEKAPPPEATSPEPPEQAVVDDARQNGQAGDDHKTSVAGRHGGALPR